MASRYITLLQSSSGAVASLLKQAKCQEKVPSRQSPQAQQALCRFMSFCWNVCTQTLPFGFIAVFDSDITTLAPSGSIPGLHRSDGWMMHIAPSAMAGNLPSLEKHGEILQDEFLQMILVWNVYNFMEISMGWKGFLPHFDHGTKPRQKFSACPGS